MAVLSPLDWVANDAGAQFRRAGLEEQDYEIFIALRYNFPKSFLSASEYITNKLESIKLKSEQVRV